MSIVNQSNQTPDLLTVPEAIRHGATFTGGQAPLSRDAIYSLARSGQLKTVGSRRRLFIVRSSLEQVLKGEI